MRKLTWLLSGLVVAAAAELSPAVGLEGDSTEKHPTPKQGPEPSSEKKPAKVTPTDTKDACSDPKTTCSSATKAATKSVATVDGIPVPIRTSKRGSRRDVPSTIETPNKGRIQGLGPVLDAAKEKSDKNVSITRDRLIELTGGEPIPVVEFSEALKQEARAARQKASPTKPTKSTAQVATAKSKRTTRRPTKQVARSVSRPRSATRQVTRSPT